jgi:hypothetical protein
MLARFCYRLHFLAKILEIALIFDERQATSKPVVATIVGRNYVIVCNLAPRSASTFVLTPPCPQDRCRLRAYIDAVNN